MNLHALVRSAIQTVNPDIAAQLVRNTGYGTGPSGRQEPIYGAPEPVTIQVQAASSGAIERMNNLSMQGVFRTVYMYGNTLGIVRADRKGGDLLRFPQVPGAPAQEWKVVEVPETWPDWCCLTVVLQVPAT